MRGRGRRSGAPRERLAASATSSLERAHHLARCVEAPDEQIAAEAEAAASEAAALGVPGTAQGLAAAAARLSVQTKDRTRRAVKAAELRIVSGDPEGARVDLESLVTELPPGASRARVLALIADVVLTIDPARGLALQQQALEEAGDDPALGAESSSVSRRRRGTRGRSTRRSRTCGPPSRSRSMRRATRCSRCAWESRALRDDPRAAVRRSGRSACARPRGVARSPPGSYFRPSISLAVVYVATDRLEEARVLLERELERIEGIGDEGIRWGVLARFADLELRAGRFGPAVERARDALDAARQLDHAGIERFALLPYAAALSRVGDLEGARIAARDALDQSNGAGSRLTALRALGILGFCELSAGDADAAWSTLEPAVAELGESGIGELLDLQRRAGSGQFARHARPGRRRARDRRVGRALRRAGAANMAPGRRDARPCAGRCRGGRRRRGTRGRRRRAGRRRRPRPAFRACPHPARAGSDRAPREQRAEARSALTAALELFDGLGAPLWAERAAAERIPGRAPRSGDLSETEQRVAELVAKGLSNKEVAASLFVTVRTVESNLSKVYAKLGVRSRSELASRFNAATR